MNKIIFFLIILKDAAIFVGRWVQVHNGFVSSVATVVIAAFTIILWWTNRKLWRVSKKTADAAKTTVETMQSQDRAYIFVQVKLKNSEEPKENIIKVGDNQVEIIFTNYGKTPAILMNASSLCISVASDFVTTELIAKIERITSKNDSQIPPGTIVIGSEKSWSIYKAKQITTEEWRHISFETIKLVCFGIIQYKIIFGGIHKTGFCWGYEPFHAFAPNENPKHNYYT